MKEGKEKAPRNKTIDFSLDSAEGKKYRKRIMEMPTDAVELKTVLDQTICGDSFAVMDRLPRGFVDLLIVDPPYNLEKDYHGNKFKGKQPYICLTLWLLLS